MKHNACLQQPGSCPLVEWLVEAGIGEDRAIQLRDGQIIAARIAVHGGLQPGTINAARITRKLAGAKAIVQLDGGADAMLRRLPAGMCEGESLLVQITRSAIAEAGRHKLPLARAAEEGAKPCLAPSLAQELGATGLPVRSMVPGAPLDAFAAAGWDELLLDALAGQLDFPGGSLLISHTPAMTVVDVDGDLPPRTLCLAAAAALADAVALFDLGGSIAVDFPSLAARVDRQAIDQALAGIAGERTAMNGFGLVQIVRQLVRPSLIDVMQGNPAAAAARMLMRRAERACGTGPIILIAPPSVSNATPSGWLDILQSRTGASAITWQIEESLAPQASHAHRSPQ